MLKAVQTLLLFLVGVLVVIIAFSIAVSHFIDRRQHVTDTVFSPDAAVIAEVLSFEASDGWTTHDIRMSDAHGILKASEIVAWLANPIRESCKPGVDLRWESNNTLVVRYAVAESKNVLQDTIELKGRKIAVRLIGDKDSRCGKDE